MPLYRCQIASQADSVLARDATVNTIYLDDTGLGTDADGLAADLVNAFQLWYGTARQIEARLYDMSDEEPRPVKGRAIENVGVAPASLGPREIALCLSFYGERNLPSQRGRIYLGVATSGTAFNMLRPSLAIRTDALELATALAGVGGVDVDWVIYSPTTNDHEQVTTAWVDDEWDTMRSRGLKPTTRSTLAVGS